MILLSLLIDIPTNNECDNQKRFCSDVSCEQVCVYKKELPNSYCSNCGKKLDAEDNYCNICGIKKKGE